MRKGVDLMVIDKDNWIVFYYVIQGGCFLFCVVELMLNQGLDINVKFVLGIVFLYIVVCYGYLDCVDFLLF